MATNFNLLFSCVSSGVGCEYITKIELALLYRLRNDGLEKAYGGSSIAPIQSRFSQSVSVLVVYGLTNGSKGYIC